MTRRPATYLGPGIGLILADVAVRSSLLCLN
jgi:hypothetical protein